MNCAAHDSSRSSAPAERHSCHEASDSGINLLPGAHTCGHQNDGIVALQTPGHDMPAPALITSSIATMVEIEHQPRAARSAPLAQSPPSRSSLNAPLRL
jgi:hypothetical protein